jgi:P-type Ca2+ transporter type 2C
VNSAPEPQGHETGITRTVTHSPVSYTEEGQSPSTTIDPMASSWSSHQRSYSGQQPDLHGEKSFENRDSRPTSPHNVSSPVTSRGNDRTHGFLAVPNTLRSRQNSVDSEEGSRSFVSSQGETVIGSGSYQGDKITASSSSHSSDNEKIMHDEDALKPDQGKEEDFDVVDNPFAFSPGALNKMFNPKSLSAFWKLGGLAGLEKGLRTDRKAGLSIDEVELEGRVTFDEATARTHDKDESAGVEHSKSETVAPTSSHPARVYFSSCG